MRIRWIFKWHSFNLKRSPKAPPTLTVYKSPSKTLSCLKHKATYSLSLPASALKVKYSHSLARLNYKLLRRFARVLEPQCNSSRSVWSYWTCFWRWRWSSSGTPWIYSSSSFLCASGRYTSRRGQPRSLRNCATWPCWNLSLSSGFKTAWSSSSACPSMKEMLLLMKVAPLKAMNAVKVLWTI